LHYISESVRRRHKNVRIKLEFHAGDTRVEICKVFHACRCFLSFSAILARQLRLKLFNFYFTA